MASETAAPVPLSRPPAARKSRWRKFPPARPAKSAFSNLPPVAFSNTHRGVQLLAQNPAHHLRQILARFFQHERLRRIRPSQFEARRQRRNPNLTHRRIRADHKPRLFLVLELNFQLAAAAFHLEIMLIAEFG